MMRTVNLLVGNSDRRLNNLIEAAVLDVCYNQAAVECTRAFRADDFQRHGSYGVFQLIIVAADGLLAGPRRRGMTVDMDEVVETIRGIKAQCSTPILVLGVSEEAEWRVLEAGADKTFGLFQTEEFKAAVRDALRLSEPVAEAEVQDSSWGGALWRGLQRLRSA
jgi:hypothetical protein